MRVIALLLAMAPVVLTQALLAQPTYAPSFPTVEEQRRFRDADQAMSRWASDARERHHLDRVACSALNRLSCEFSLDGATVAMAKSLAGPDDMRAYFSMGNDFRPANGRLEVVSGKWIKVGDLFELEVGAKIYPYACLQLGEGENSVAQCRAAFNFAESADRVCHPEHRYVFGAYEGPEVARAFVRGELKVRHNGAVMRWPALIAGASDFAKQDFSKVLPK